MMSRFVYYLLLLIVGATAFVGCASKKPELRPVRVAVVDGFRFDGLMESSSETVGFWVHRREYYRQPNSGVVFADELARELKDVPGLNVWSREDWRVYQSQKERLLRRGDSTLSSEQRRQILNRQDPVDYGKSMSVDYVIRPIVDESFLTTNQFVAWWYSKLVAEIEVWDVNKGERVYTWNFDDTDAFDSQIAMMREASRKFAHNVKKEDLLGVRVTSPSD